MLNTMRRVAILLSISLCAPLLFASGVTVVWNPADPTMGPFPTDFLTVLDGTQKSGLRVNLPMPDCTTAPSDCQDVQLINQLDGFQTAPRIRINFSGPIDVTTVHHAVYYVELKNLTQEEHGIMKPGQMLYMTQMIYDPTTNSLYGKPDGNLDQHSLVAVVVLDVIRDLDGNPIQPDAGFSECVTPQPQVGYCTELSQAVNSVAGAVAPAHIVGGTVFTTMNVTTWLEQAYAQLPNLSPPPTPLTPPTLLQYASLSSLVLHEQVGATPAQFVDVSLPIDNALFRGIGAIGFGTFASPNYLNSQQVIPATPTGQPIAPPGAVNIISYHVFFPSSPQPPGGYPVVIFGHGFGDSQWGGPTAVGPALAQAGFAT